jgi:ubiquinone/menaquinone biosynthesis C-methylase UbiE
MSELHITAGVLPMDHRTAEKYSRVAKRYDMSEYPFERFLFRELRSEAISYARKNTLEVGVGTGKNFPYYASDIELTAIDFSPGMLKIAQEKKKDIHRRSLRLYEMDVEHLTFDNDSFDAVVSTFVFCTVPDPIAGLKEIHRVLKPSGRAIFLEHMKSRHHVVNLFLYAMNIFSTRLLGTSMVRETQRNIESAGFTVESADNKFLDVIRFIIAGKRL